MVKFWPLLASPLLLSAAAAPSAAPASAPTALLCKTGETVIFQCGAGRRTIALCGSAAGAGAKTVEYRFGTPAKLELVHSSRAGGMVQAGVGYSGGGASQVRFDRGGYSYIVYSRMVRTGFNGTNNPAFDAGVVVRKAGSRDLKILCTAPKDAALNSRAARSYLPEAEFVDIDR